MKSDRKRGVSGSRLVMAAVAIGLPMASGIAQTTQRGGSPANLPRPGFEPIVHHVGPAEMLISVDGSAIYDTNVYATSTRAQDDGIFVLRPSIDVTLQDAGLSAHGIAYAEARQHVSVTREDAFLFGLLLEGAARFSPQQGLDATFKFDRSVQPRSDPEARAPITVPPRKINVLSAGIGYTARAGDFSFRLSPGADRIDFLDPAERDRDLRVYRSTARATWQPAAPVAFFLEGFITRRDADLRRDFAGVDRDVTTYGALLGASREVNARVRGSMGVGVFRSEPDDPSLRPYTGFAVDGQVTWTPRARTQVTIAAFRGDVATVRVGASGRTDTRVSASIEQEARHNLLLSGEVGWRRSVFRGAGDKQDIVQGRVGAEYLATRRFSLFGDATLSRRDATIPLDEFSRGLLQVGVRARF
ncbi:outer membrane beta-barrel protein [Sphingomonas sp. IC-11]|nr:outer membrane beta-barrel protein [Sphingomonas sp. IC-11]